MPYMLDRDLVLPDRMIPLETGFSPPSLLTEDPDESRLVAEAAAFYGVSDRGMIELKPEVQAGMIERKQIGLLYGEWIIANLGGHLPYLNIYNIEQETLHEVKHARLNHPGWKEHLAAACTLIEAQRGRRFDQCLAEGKANPRAWR